MTKRRVTKKEILSWIDAKIQAADKVAQDPRTSQSTKTWADGYKSGLQDIKASIIAETDFPDNNLVPVGDWSDPSGSSYEYCDRPGARY